jgi:hypothetical protein
MINAKLQNIIDTKSAIGNAIVNKGGTITGETPFFNYAAQIDSISTGTPQTIFQASDGSKWALTNAVNLTNVSNNVTSDFNYWQPANNSTSDPILNIGTVGANISGNIQLVQVNQVNIAQYVNIVATDTDGAKYVGYNGYDSQTNPTPTGNTTFNRWLLNNSATGTVLFANATFTTGTFNGPNSSVNEASMPFVNNFANYGSGALIKTLATNNGFIYVGGLFGTDRLEKFYESNLAFVGNTVNYGGWIYSMVINNGSIYIGGQADQRIKQFREDNLAFVTNSGNLGGVIRSMALNNGFIYASGAADQTIGKFHESNLALVGNTAAYGGLPLTIDTSDGFIYVGGQTNQTVQKFYESNLVRVGNTADYGGAISTLKTNNGFIYVGGFSNQTVQKFHESNLAFVGNTPSYNSAIKTLTTNNGFIYAGGGGDADNDRDIKKYYESNLTFVTNTVRYPSGDFEIVITNNGFIYGAGQTNNTVQKFQEAGINPDNQTFYTATKIKE